MAETVDARPLSIFDDFKPWRTGQPYNFPLPKSDGGDPWKILLEQRKRDDYGRCEVWKDEVQNLLIFAGLFSAVVTAFVVESYTALQEDPSERIVLLLNHISSQLRDPLPSNQTMPPDSDFSVNASDLRVNFFWFLSLIFSLATVLIGIVSLQWIREYQRSRNIEPRLAFALHHMHTESLDAWYMPEIFASLPLLLQLALVLFLIGLCDFAWKLNLSLAIPIIITIILTLTFLIVTTVLPTLHAMTLLFRRRDEGNPQPRVQCPYNSPQAWAFHRFYCLLYSLYRELRLWHRLFLRVQTFASHQIQLQYLFQIDHYNFGWSWTDLGVGWLFQRDADYVNARPSLLSDSLGHPQLRRIQLPGTSSITLYDSAMALKIARDTVNPSTDREVLTALYACVSELVDSTSGNLGYNQSQEQWVNYSYYVENLVTPAVALYIPKHDQDLPSLLDESNWVSFFRGNPQLIHTDKVLRENIIERSVRLAEYLYGQGEMRQMIPVTFFKPVSYLPALSTPLYIASSSGENGEQLDGLGDQIAVMIRRFFETILEYQLPEEPPFLSHTGFYAYQFLHAAVEILLRTPSASAFAYNEQTLKLLTDWLHQSHLEGIKTDITASGAEPSSTLLHSTTSLKQQYVFTLAFIYAHCLQPPTKWGRNLTYYPFNIDASEMFANLKGILKTIYDERFKQVVSAFSDEVEHADTSIDTGGIREIDGIANTAKEKMWQKHMKEMLWGTGLYSNRPEEVYLFATQPQPDPWGDVYNFSASGLDGMNGGQQGLLLDSSWRDAGPSQVQGSNAEGEHLEIVVVESN